MEYYNAVGVRDLDPKSLPEQILGARDGSRAGSALYPQQAIWPAVMQFASHIKGQESLLKRLWVDEVTGYATRLAYLEAHGLSTESILTHLGVYPEPDWYDPLYREPSDIPDEALWERFPYLREMREALVKILETSGNVGGFNVSVAGHAYGGRREQLLRKESSLRVTKDEDEVEDAGRERG